MLLEQGYKEVAIDGQKPPLAASVCPNGLNNSQRWYRKMGALEFERNAEELQWLAHFKKCEIIYDKEM